MCIGFVSVDLLWWYTAQISSCMSFKEVGLFRIAYLSSLEMLFTWIPIRRPLLCNSLTICLLFLFCYSFPESCAHPLLNMLHAFYLDHRNIIEIGTRDCQKSRRVTISNIVYLPHISSCFRPQEHCFHTFWFHLTWSSSVGLGAGLLVLLFP